MPADLAIVLADQLRFDHRVEDWYAWRDRLPALVRDVLAEWQLSPDGYTGVGECSLVVGVTTVDGRSAALKFGWPHSESRHEHLALRAWNGSGAVRLLRADPVRSVLLLERASSIDLSSLPVRQACDTVARLYRRLHRAALPQLDNLSVAAARWAAELRAVPTSAAVPHRLMDHAAALAEDFAADPATDGILIHTDLHYANVLAARQEANDLAARREPWLAIDPKPMSGDPSYEVAPLLWNRWDEIDDGGGARNGVRRRFDLVVSVAGLDPDRARDWTIVRGMVNAKNAIGSAAPAESGVREWITRCVTIAKAVQD